MKKLWETTLMLVAFCISSCTPDPAATQFTYRLGTDNNSRTSSIAAFHYSPADSVANLMVAFDNGDSLHLLWVTPCYPAKQEYVFGQYYFIDSDIMIMNFKNNAANPPYWVLDQGIYKSGSLTISAWANNAISGSFNFNANTMNPQTFSTAVLNFNGSFSNIPVVD